MGVKIDLNGLGVIVTASSRGGIGFNVARELLKRNARVVVSSRAGGDNLRKAADELSSYGEVYAVRANLLDQRDLENLVKEGWELLGGGVNALVWNAGNVACEPCLLHEANYIDWVEAAALHTVAPPGYLTTLLVQAWLEKGMRGNARLFELGFDKGADATAGSGGRLEGRPRPAGEERFEDLREARDKGSQRPAR